MRERVWGGGGEVNPPFHIEDLKRKVRKNVFGGFIFMGDKSKPSQDL